MATKIAKALAAIVVVGPLAFLSCGGDDPTQDTTQTEGTVETLQSHTATSVPGAASARFQITPRVRQTPVPHPFCPTCPQGANDLGAEQVR